MLRQFLVVTSIASLPVINEYAKTHITKTNGFKKAITQINKELKDINITLDKTRQLNSSNQQQPIVQNQQEERLFDLILTPQIEKMLSTKAKHKVQLIKKLRYQQKQMINTNAFLMGIHSVGTFVNPAFFYWSAIFYSSLSQLSIINDLYTLKTGNQIVDLHSKTIGELYLKVSAVMLLVFGIRTGLRRLQDMVQTKQIVKRDS